MDLYRKLVLAGLLMAVQFAFAWNDAAKDTKRSRSSAAWDVPAQTALR
jgi:hypothetical protein